MKFPKTTFFVVLLNKEKTHCPILPSVVILPHVPLYSNNSNKSILGQVYRKIDVF